MSSTMSTTRGARRGRGWLLWLPGLAVALGAGAATAHGLFEVSAAAGVPSGLAWLYPLITDGLALVAYVSTIRLDAGDRLYAWSVVVLAAGLSGLAQAAYLAGGVGEVSSGLRFGVGAWPAIAAAIVAHLLFLLARSSTADPVAAAECPETEIAEPEPVESALVESAGGYRSAAVPLSARPVQPLVSRPVSNDDAGPGVQVSSGEGVQPAEVSSPEASNLAGGRSGSGARDRARAAARRHLVQHGELPSVRELERLCEVSRGSAHAALKELREHPTRLHVINSDQEAAQP